MRGEALISPSITRRLIAEFANRPDSPRKPDHRLDALTTREREVMQLIAAGRTNDEIAAQLVVSPLTAKTHVSRIMAKLGARDRSQVVVMAYEYRMVAPGRLTD
jgi:DNA-binding NarL/FixJ family response regulator